MSEIGMKKNAVFNPGGKAVDTLPVIYGFNNGGQHGWMDAVLLAEDGTYLGGHVCSHEGYMWGDLGIIEGCRPDRHETFRSHYPNGYRMEFVGYNHVKANAGLMAAIERSKHDEPVTVTKPAQPEPSRDPDLTSIATEQGGG